MSYRLVALDADGTVLDPSGTLRPVVQQAVLAVQQRGLQVVLCTGRRFRTALPLALELQLQGPIIVHNGALVKEVPSCTTLHQVYMSPLVYQQALTHLRPFGSPMVYVDAFEDNIDILTEDIERAHPFQRQYLEDNLTHCRMVQDIATPPDYGVVMISIMADEPSLRSLRPRLTAALGSEAHVGMLINKNYQGHVLEVLPSAVSKWQALYRLATAEGISAEEIIAIGDDENDLEMIRHAGLGIAMGNARNSVKAVADYITGNNADDGLVPALERFVLQP